MTNILQKKDIRNTIRSKLRANPPSTYHVHTVYAGLSKWIDSLHIPVKNVGLYIPIRGEVDPRPLIPYFHLDGYTVCVPVGAKQYALLFGTYTGQEGLILNTWLMPLKYTRCIPDVIIAPALAVTKSGYRLGYGGGYYDRTLAKFSGGTAVLVWRWQLVTSLPVTSFDKPFSFVFSVDSN